MLCASGTVGIIAATLVASPFYSVKVNYVEMWAPPASQGASSTVSINWESPNAPNVEISDTTVSVAVPAHLKCKPPSHSLAAFWQNVGSGTIFSLVAPVGTIIDVSLSLVMFDEDDGSTTPATSAVATATLGLVYYLSLDPNATHRYAPVALTTTI
jgi:hypothetical protein